MALGALSLPSVSTGFTSDSKSILPVSIEGMSNQIAMALDNSSMELTLAGIFDAIHDTSLDTLKSFTMLQKTLVTGFSMLGDSLRTLVNIAVKDLGLEDTQTDLQQKRTKIAEGNEADQDQDDSLSQGDKKEEGKGILTNSFKGGVIDTLKQIMPTSLIGKAILLGVGIAGFAMSIDGVAKVVGKIAEFTSKEVVPRVMKLGENTKEYFTNLFDGLYGENGFFPVFMDEFTNIKDAVESGDYKAAVFGVKDLLVRSTISAVSVLGTSIVGIIKAGLGIIDPNADTSDIDKLIKFFKDLPGNVTKELSEQAKEYQKVLEEDGFGAAQVVAFRQTYDNLIGRSLNGLSNFFGVVLKPFISDETYDTMLRADFRIANIKSSLRISMENLGDSLGLMENAISIFVNDKLDAINGFTSIFGIPEIPKMPVKSIVGQNSYVNDDGERVPMNRELLIGKDINVLGKPDVSIENPVDRIMKQLEKDANDYSFGYKSSSFSASKKATNLELSDMMNNKDSRMKVKTEEIKTLAAEVIVPLAKPSNTIIADNKTINTNTSSSTTIASNQRVDSIEPSSNALLHYYRHNN